MSERAEPETAELAPPSRSSDTEPAAAQTEDSPTRAPDAGGWPGPRRNAGESRSAFRSVVQRLENGGGSKPSDPVATAEAGTSGGGSALPHLDAIQASFGHHDVSGVRAFEGGSAAEASQSLGAKAFAVGDAVGFASAPDLHTAAHEAAHVVQQRGGVQLSGGIDGGASDPYERHADAVADMVVRGESAEALLGGGGAGGSHVVQRKEGDDGKTDTSELADGEHFRVLADGSVLISSDWLLSDPAKQVTDQGLLAPTRMAEILEAMRTTGGFSWMDPAMIPSYSQKIGIPGGVDPKSKVGRYGIGFNVYQLIGPPPNVDVVTARDGEGLAVVLRQSIAIPGVVDQTKVIELPAIARDKIVTGMEDYTKLKADPGFKNTVINTDIHLKAIADPAAKGVMVQFTRSDMEKLFTQPKWDAYLKQPQKQGGSGVITGHSGAAEPVPHWLPKGVLQVNPKQAQYVTGSEVQVEVKWDLSVHPDAGFILLPNHCNYKWKVRHELKLVDSESTGIFLDERDPKLTLNGGPGKYEIEVTATSDHFLTPHHDFTAHVTLQAIDEKAFDKQTFDKVATGKDQPFTRDPGGALHLKPQQHALTVKDELGSLAMTEGAIDALEKKGELTETDHDTLKDQLEKQRKALEEIAKKTASGTPYIVRGSFVSREDSSSTPMHLLMHMMHRGTSDGLGEYSVLLHDTTFGDPTQHPGSSKGPVAKDVDSAYQKLETDALDDMADHMHAHNDYPSGTVHVAAQMLTGGRVWETTRDTDNGRKTAKKVLGGVAMIGGVALLFIPGGGFVSAAVFAVTATAGVGSVALEIEDRYQKEGELKFDRRLALDVLQVVSVALPFGTMTRVLSEARLAVRAGYLVSMTGVDAAQGFMIAQDVASQLRLIDANTALELTQATTEDQKRQIMMDRDRKVAQVVGGAMVNGGFILISLGAGIKRIAATMTTGVTIQVREPVANIKSSGLTAIEETLNKGYFEHEGERVVLNDEERSLLEDEVASLKRADATGGSGAGDDKGGGGSGKDHEPPAGGGKDHGSGGKSPEPDAQTADDLKKYSNAEQQQADMVAAEKGTATKEQRERLAQDLRRQVPDIALLDAVRSGDAKTVISVVTPGGGEMGIKKMNDELISYQFNSNRLIPGRNKIIKEAFESQGFKVVDQNYKTTTFVSDKAPADTTAGMDAAAKQIDAKMKPLLEQVLDEASQHFKQDVAKRTPPDPEIELGKARIKKMADLRKQIAANKDFHFDFQMGAAELKGGKDATYEDVLGSEMNATKGAIMARDQSFTPKTGGAGGRAMVFDDAEFVTFAKETVGIKDRLTAENATLPYHGERLKVFDGGSLNRDILRAVRKGSYKEVLNAADKKTLESVEQYFKRVNSLDYIKHFTGDEVGAQGQKVAETAALVKQLEGDKPISKEAADQIQATLSSGTPQADAGNEAQFYAKAATLHERVVLNADIKDMGLDLFAGYEKSLDTIGRNPKADVGAVSTHASDNIVELKRNAANAFKNFYTNELWPKAKELAAAQHRQDLVDALSNESEPVMLLGGDEITVSLNKAFEELGLLPEAVAKLTSPEVANARVAVTKTGAGPGAAGHVAAMKAAQGGQDLLKKDFEPKARELRTKAAKLPSEQAASARDLADRIDRMYTEERSGKTQLMDTDGSVVEPEHLEKEVRAILDAKEVPGAGTGSGDKGGSGDKDPPKDPPGGGGGGGAGVPEHIPQNREDFRAFVSTKYAEIVQKYQNADHTARPEYLPLIEEMKKLPHGEADLPANQAKVKELMDRWMAIGKQIASEPGSGGSTEATDLRGLYNHVEREDMPRWQQELQQAGVSKEVQARLANMHRTEIKLFTRDLMLDDNSKEFLYLRDLALYGNRSGPTFDDLMTKNTNKKGMTQDQSYDDIIASSQTSNKTVNKGLTGSDTGIKKDDGSR